MTFSSTGPRLKMLHQNPPTCPVWGRRWPRFQDFRELRAPLSWAVSQCFSQGPLLQGALSLQLRDLWGAQDARGTADEPKLQGGLGCRSGDREAVLGGRGWPRVKTLKQAIHGWGLSAGGRTVSDPAESRPFHPVCSAKFSASQSQQRRFLGRIRHRRTVLLLFQR